MALSLRAHTTSPLQEQVLLLAMLAAGCVFSADEANIVGSETMTDLSMVGTAYSWRSREMAGGGVEAMSLTGLCSGGACLWGADAELRDTDAVPSMLGCAPHRVVIRCVSQAGGLHSASQAKCGRWHPRRRRDHQYGHQAGGTDDTVRRRGGHRGVQAISSWACVCRQPPYLLFPAQLCLSPLLTTAHNRSATSWRAPGGRPPSATASIQAHHTRPLAAPSQHSPRWRMSQSCTQV